MILFTTKSHLTLNSKIPLKRVKNIKNNITKYYNYINYGMKNAYDLNETSKRELGYNLKDIVLFCNFNSEVYDEKDFIWMFSYWYGNCFQFNPNMNQKNGYNLAGANYGLMMIVKNLTNFNSYLWTFGLGVFIHKNSDFISSAEQVFIETRKITFLQLKKAIVSPHRIVNVKICNSSNLKNTVQ